MNDDVGYITIPQLSVVSDPDRISRRDYFAAAALTGMLGSGYYDLRAAAGEAFKHADAMIEAGEAAEQNHPRAIEHAPLETKA